MPIGAKLAFSLYLIYKSNTEEVTSLKKLTNSQMV